MSGSSSELNLTATDELSVQVSSILHLVVFSVFWGSSLTSRAEWLGTSISVPLSTGALLHGDHEGFVSTQGLTAGLNSTPVGTELCRWMSFSKVKALSSSFLKQTYRPSGK